MCLCAEQDIAKTNTQELEIIKELMTEITDLKWTVQTLRRIDTEKENVISELKEKLDGIKRDYKYETKIVRTKNDLTSNVNIKVISKRSSPRLSRRRRAPVNVAFSAYLSKNVNLDLNNTAIPFDKVLLNDGARYNSTTGTFTAPLSGIYAFTFTFDTKLSALVRLAIDGVNQIDGVANGHRGATGINQIDMGGNVCIVHMNHGQTVTVQVDGNDGTTINSSENFRLTTFSGFLLY